MSEARLDPTLEAALTRYVALLRDPAAGRALYDMYAPDAPLYLDQGVYEQAMLPGDLFADMLAASAESRHEALGEPLRPDLEAPRALSAKVVGDEALVWFAAREAVADHELTGAVGFKRVAGAWRVHWATLGAPADWSFGYGRAQALADVAIADGARLGLPRGWLDVAYYREFLKPRPPLLTLPEARFRCNASLGCCDIGYRIEVPPSAQAVVDAMPWAEIRPQLAGTQLAPQGNGKLLVKEAGERCRFLDEDKHCVLHKALGRAVFPVCTLFPVHFAHTPTGVAVSLDMTCPSARKALGPPLADRAEDLYMRLAMQPPRSQVTTFHLAPDHEVPWEAFEAAEAELLAILAGPGPLPERLAAGSRALHARLGVEIPPYELGEADRARGVALVEDAARLMLPDLADGALRWPDAADGAAEIAQAMRGGLFTKNYSFSLDLLTAWHIALFQALAIARVLAAFPGQAPPARELWQLNGLFFHTNFFTTLHPDLPQAAALMQAFGRPEFGWALLSLPEPPAGPEGEPGPAETSSSL